MSKIICSAGTEVISTLMVVRVEQQLEMRLGRKAETCWGPSLTHKSSGCNCQEEPRSYLLGEL